MIPVHVAFSGYAIIGLTLLILAATISFYLLRLPEKSDATWSLIVFFALVALSGVATILTNALFYWDRLFSPWQDFWILAGGVALSQFPYSFPRYERSPEAKIVLAMMGSLALLALSYSIYFSYRFIFVWTPDLQVSDTYYLLLPISIGLVVVIFLYRSITYSKRTEMGENSSGKRRWHYLVAPQGQQALALRNMALALSLAFLPGLQTLFGFPAPYGFVLSNLGSLLAITAIAYVYFNATPDVNSFMAKLTGITLTSVLLIFSVAGALGVYRVEQEYNTQRESTLAIVSEALIESGYQLTVPADSSVVYMVSWDAASLNEATTYRQLFVRPGVSGFKIDDLIASNRQGYLDTFGGIIGSFPDQSPERVWRFVYRFGAYPVGSNQPDYESFLFTRNGITYEFGFSVAEQENYLSQVIVGWLILILVSSALILLLFPLFFRKTLVKPLGNLLEGIGRVNDGELETAVSISFNDEIGSLTRSFNNLTKTLSHSQSRQKELIAELQVASETLEERVTLRTRELSAFTELTLLSGEQDDLTYILQPALSHILETGLCQALCVHLLPEDKDALEIVAHRFLPETAVFMMSLIPLSSEAAAQIRQADEPILIGQEKKPSILPVELLASPFQAYLGCPLVAGVQSLGWLSCYRQTDDSFNISEISLLVALARQLGVLVENQRLRQTIQQVAAFEERKRLARDLHDSVTQLLYSMTLFTRTCQEAVEDGDDTRLAFGLNRLSDTSQQALREMRFMLFELQSPSLEAVGLVEALEARFDMVERRSGVHITFETGDIVLVSKAVEHEFYYVALEALNNSLKHAQADQVHLEIKRENGCICLIITDNGRGFDTAQVSHGMGLSNMRHRAESLGGALQIETTLEIGTKIMMTVPMTEPIRSEL